MHVLNLPREVRDQIYAYYFILENGYRFNFTTKKLEANPIDGNRVPIDQSLRLTCKQIADETRGCALSLNFISFTADNPTNSVSTPLSSNNASTSRPRSLSTYFSIHRQM
ncbi:hypothetical protein B0I35DRAFT_481386 [Stachybotrys elegans]|uniref:Uncharacterized protein n=1 Tax=Stachybotrys elegans TaxID=80388 RepID=A0A8K0WN22_9HYPO|nr:hypothetical protein B0I35DRAFT_481386 [Stachybotrys elegans]